MAVQGFVCVNTKPDMWSYSSLTAYERWSERSGHNLFGRRMYLYSIILPVYMCCDLYEKRNQNSAVTEERVCVVFFSCVFIFFLNKHSRAPSGGRGGKGITKEQVTGCPH